MAETPSDPPRLLADLVRLVGEELDVAEVDLWTHDRELDALICQALWMRDGDGPAPQELVGTAVPLRQSPDLARLVLTGEAIARHVDDDALAPPELAALRARGHQTRLDVPLCCGDEVLGVMSVAETRWVRRFTVAEERSFARLRELVATVVAQARRDLVRDERDRRLLVLLKAARAMSTSLRTDEALAGVAEGVAGLLAGIPVRTEVLVRQDDGGFARLDAGSLGDGDDAGLVVVHADALARQSFDLRRAEQSRDGDGRRRLVVPLVVGDEAYGVLDTRGGIARPFTAEEVELVRLLADQAALALRNARRVRLLERRTASDATTGLYSAWYFQERLYSEVARARRYRQPLALLAGALDGYAAFAAERGPAAGELVLAHLGRMVRASLRDRVDVACSRGAGGFMVLLPHTPGLETGAGLVAERIRRTVEQNELKDDDLGTLGRFTVSLGVAGLPLHAEEADDLAATAEASLRTALGAGGNRVVHATA